MSRNLNGGINLHRQLLNNPILKSNANRTYLWITLLLLARWSQKGDNNNEDRAGKVLFKGVG